MSEYVYTKGTDHLWNKGKRSKKKMSISDEKTGRLVIEMPLDGFTPEKLDNLTRLITAKSSLLKTGADGAES